MIFLTTRTYEDVLKAKKGDRSTETLSKATLSSSVFARWKIALTAIYNALGIALPYALPTISASSEINCTNPTIAYSDPMNMAGTLYIDISTLPLNNPTWYYWKAVSALVERTPTLSDSIDIRAFPENMDNLSYENINAMERVMEWYYTDLGLT